MTPSFGRSLRRRGVDFLLISGQATVLYGAATFSEDVDLWVEPSRANLRRLRLALRDLKARVYKLTPPLTPRNARMGHGFHFLIPSGRETVYLDVMGRPPRAGSFRACKARSERLRTSMGVLPVMGIEDLVEIKKTRRLGDYDVINALVRIRLEEKTRPAAALLRWALLNTFSQEDLASLLERHPRARALARTLRRQALALAGRPGACGRAIAAEVAALQQRDLKYWKPVLAEIRTFRAEGSLLPEGSSL